MPDTKLSNIPTQITYTQLSRIYATNSTPASAYINPQQELEQRIYEPASEPEIVTGTPNELTIDLNSARQGIFEPRLSSSTYTINVDFDFWVVKILIY